MLHLFAVVFDAYLHAHLVAHAGAALAAGHMDQAQWLEYAAGGNEFSVEPASIELSAEKRFQGEWIPQV